MPSYDTTRFSPPAPVGLIEIRNPATGAVHANVPMLIDTGADITLLPRQYIAQLNLPIEAAEAYELLGFDGARSTAPAVHLDLIFLGRTFRGRFALIDQPDGIIGRNILNHLHLAFNGPGLQWDKIG